MPFLGAIQPIHLLLILAIVLVVFGAGKLGQVGGALGQSIKEFKSNVNDPEEEARKAAEEQAAQVAATKTTVKAVPVAAKTEVVTVAPRETATLRREEI
jgi:sec-independent protein translocase protein TatA